MQMMDALDRGAALAERAVRDFPAHSRAKKRMLSSAH